MAEAVSPPSYEESRSHPRIISVNDNIALTDDVRSQINEAYSRAQNSSTTQRPAKRPSLFQRMVSARKVVVTKATTTNGGKMKQQWKQMKGAFSKANILPKDQETRKKWKENLEFMGYVIIGTLCVAVFVLAFASLIVLI